MRSNFLGDAIHNFVRSLRAQHVRHHSDADLLSQFVAARDEAAFEALVRRHGPMVLSLCQRVLRNRQDIEDAFQAVFLVLIRKADAIGRRELLANWLHGVSCRVAMQVRDQAPRWTGPESESVDMLPAEPIDDETWHDLRRVLDEELNRLPEKYRLPLILCYLQGKTNKAAAEELGWSAGSMSRRLAKGRDLLRQRLVSRGVAISAAALANVLTSETFAAVVPVSLLTFTMKLASLFKAGDIAEGVVSASVAALAKGAAKAMFASKVKVGAAIVMAVGLVGGGAGVVVHKAVAGRERAGESQKPEGRKQTAESRRRQPNATAPKPQTVASDETKDLGDLHAKSLNDTVNQTEERVVISGRVSGPAGNPLAGANVAAIAMRTGVRPGGDFSQTGEVLAQATTDGEGCYKLIVTGVSTKSHGYGNLIARKEGFGVAWRQLDLAAASLEASFTLVPEEPIRGKLVDSEGQPARGVRLLARSVMPTSKTGEPSDSVSFRCQAFAAAWVPPVMSDGQGHFTIHGVPSGHGIYLEAEGGGRFAPQPIALNTGMAEQRGERDGTYRSLVKNAKRGEEVVLALAPAQLFEGIVTYADTEKPAPHARLTIWASQQEFGSMVAVAGQADENGRYRIAPYPGVRFGVTAYPPDGVPYLARQTPLSKAIGWTTADKVKRVDVSLPRGVLARGQIVEMGGRPIAWASIQYVPEEGKNRRVPDDILTGWQAIQVSGKDGRFEFAVLPGPGRLLVHGPTSAYILQEIGGRELRSGGKGGDRHYAHAIQKIEPAPNTNSIDVKVELRRGAVISGRVVSENGELINDVLVISRLTVYPTSLTWRGQIPPTLGGRFTIEGLEEGREYTVYFLDPKRRLGALETVKANNNERTVVLRPCGQANVRFVDKEGQPVADHYATVMMVVTPGPDRFDFTSTEKGALAADADYVGNIDRTNHGSMSKSGKDGKVNVPALVPGATYRILESQKGLVRVARDFQVRAGETLDLGDIQVETDQRR